MLSRNKAGRSGSAPSSSSWQLADCCAQRIIGPVAGPLLAPSLQRLADPTALPSGASPAIRRGSDRSPDYGFTRLTWRLSRQRGYELCGRGIQARNGRLSTPSASTITQPHRPACHVELPDMRPLPLDHPPTEPSDQHVLPDANQQVAAEEKPTPPNSFFDDVLARAQGVECAAPAMREDHNKALRYGRGSTLDAGPAFTGLRRRLQAGGHHGVVDAVSWRRAVDCNAVPSVARQRASSVRRATAPAASPSVRVRPRQSDGRCR